MEETKMGESKTQEALIENKVGAIQKSEADIIKERKEKIIKLLKSDKYFSVFVIIGALSLIFSLFLKIGINFGINFFGYDVWFVLAVLSFISAFLAYNKKYKYMFYPILLFIVWLSVQIRTRNLPLLKDVTTGTWTLGPDLDPFLFLRWAKYIIANGHLFDIDVMRFVPLGYDVRGELLLHPYMIAWFHKIAVFFGSESIIQSAVLYPVAMFALTVVAFFFLIKEIFIKSTGAKEANTIGLISSFLLTISPILLPRTIAGIPEKESAAFLFMFLALYFFLKSWNSDKLAFIILFSILSGASTAGMALIWGGYAFIFLTIAPSVLVAFFLGKVERNKLITYVVWIVASFSLMIPFSTRYPLTTFISSIMTGSSVIVLLIILFYMFVFNPFIKKHIHSVKLKNIPPKIESTLIILLLIFIAALSFFGWSFIVGEIKNIISNLIAATPGRILQTVAENRQPFFDEWSGSFGPYLRNIPLSFWLFFIGSIYLFYKMIYSLNKKERYVLTTAYTMFLFSIVFSKYSANSTFNGSNAASMVLYAIGFIVLIGSLGYYAFLFYKKDEEEKLKKIEFGFILLFMLFFFSLVSARGAVRLILMLAIPASIIISYFSLSVIDDVRKMKSGVFKYCAFVVAGIIILATLFSGIQLYKSVNAEAASYGPNVYTQQWQKAMAWVRENTPQTAVFGHWWDYGYRLQSIGERATVLDGGNAIGYWNHMMGRYALTGPNETEALEFIYAHNTTHFLIDSTDIGKYTAFSSIGSDKDYDRRSWIPIFLRDKNQMQETKNSTIFVYSGGTVLDDDTIYEENGTKIYLPAGKAGIGAVLLERYSSGELAQQPIGIFVYQNKQYKLPLKYAFINNRFINFGKGVESGVFPFLNLDQSTLDPDGAMLYLSERVVKSQLARLYLYNENDSYFKLAHSEDDALVTQIKTQNPNAGDFVYAGGFRGPIKIWDINYPQNMELNEKYLLKTIPKEMGFDL